MTQLESKIALAAIEIKIEQDVDTLCKSVAERADVDEKTVWETLMKHKKEAVLDIWSNGARNVIADPISKGFAKVRFTKGPDWPKTSER